VRITTRGLLASFGFTLMVAAALVGAWGVAQFFVS